MAVTVTPEGRDKLEINPNKIVMIVVPSALAQDNKVTLFLEGGLMIKLDQKVYDKFQFNHLITINQPE